MRVAGHDTGPISPAKTRAIPAHHRIDMHGERKRVEKYVVRLVEREDVTTVATAAHCVVPRTGLVESMSSYRLTLRGFRRF